MLPMLSHRLAGLAGTLFAASLITFFALEILPGDAAQILLGTEARDDTLAAMRAQLGIDRPMAERYVDWVLGLLTGDLGTSQIYGIPVADMVRDRLAISLPLAGMAFLLTVLIAMPIGILAAAGRGGPADFLAMGFAQIGLAIPNFWFGILLVLLFAVKLGWVSTGGFPGWSDNPFNALGALFLPALALALSEAAILSRVVRGALLETLGEDYIRTARAKGVSSSAVIARHALRNAMIPISTIMGLQFAFLVAGSIVIENVFYLPGLGRLLIQSIFQRDLIVVRDLVLMFAGIVVLVNFAVDLIYNAIDPRARVQR